MESLFETAVMASIVLAILFFAYHIGMYMIHQKATKLAADQLQKAGPVTPRRTTERLPGSPTYAEPVAPAPPAAAPAPPAVQAPVPQLPEPSDPQHKPQDTSTFITQMRQPENLFHKHEFVAGALETPALAAQNEGDMGGIAAYDCGGDTSYSAL